MAVMICATILPTSTKPLVDPVRWAMNAARISVGITTAMVMIASHMGASVMFAAPFGCPGPSRVDHTDVWLQIPESSAGIRQVRSAVTYPTGEAPGISREFDRFDGRSVFTEHARRVAAD